MSLTRSTFYWLWFVNFGVIAIFVSFTQSHPWCTEYFWLFFTGAGGIITEAKSLAPRWSRPYDVIIGIFFLVTGWIGILHNLGINLVNNSNVVSVSFLNSANVLGLSLELTFALIHVVLGFLAFKFAIRNPAMSSSFEVNTKEK